MGHLRKDCRGSFEEVDSEDCFLRGLTQEDFTTVDSSACDLFTSTPEHPCPLASGANFMGKLKSICPNLFFSLSAWEKD